LDFLAAFFAVFLAAFFAGFFAAFFAVAFFAAADLLATLEVVALAIVVSPDDRLRSSATENASKDATIA
jgi:hypothetical protein